MPQYGRPSSDKLIGNFTDNANGVTNIYTAIDETSANDTDYIRSPQSPSNQVYVTKLSNLVDPVSSANHVVRWRAGKDVGNGSEVIDMSLSLYQAYNNESSKGTEIFTQNNSNIADNWTDYTHNLSAGEADAITDYTNLYLRFLFNKP